MASLSAGNRSSSSLLFMTNFKPWMILFPLRLSPLPTLAWQLSLLRGNLFVSLSRLFSRLSLRDRDLLTRLLLRKGLFFWLLLRSKLRDRLRLLIRLFPRTWLLLLPLLRPLLLPLLRPLLRPLLLPLLRLRGRLLLRARLLARDFPLLLPRLRLRLLVTCFWKSGFDLTASFKALADLNASARLYAIFPLRYSGKGLLAAMHLRNSSPARSLKNNNVRVSNNSKHNRQLLLKLTLLEIKWLRQSYTCLEEGAELERDSTLGADYVVIR